MSTSVPVIETARLRLRGHRLDDLAASTGMWSDIRVVRFIGGKTFSREDVWARLLRYLGHWAWLGYGYWLVEEKTTGRFVGEVGFGDFKREIVPSIDGIPEVGWALANEVHGLGYATEAVRAALAWREEHFGRERTVCLIHPENSASLRVAAKCGYVEYARTVYRQEPSILLAREI